MTQKADAELEVKVRKATERVSENMHIVANEPSLAFYRLQEHVRKALNPMVDRRVEATKLHNELLGRCYDIEYAIGAIKAMGKAEESFKNIQDGLTEMIELKRRMKVENRKKVDGSSVYKRLSAHIADLPELSDVVRETANRVESIMTKASHNQ